MVAEKWFVALSGATDEERWLAALGDVPEAALEGLLRRVGLSAYELRSERIEAIRQALADGAVTLPALDAWRDDLHEALVAVDGLTDFRQRLDIVETYSKTRGLGGKDLETITTNIREALWRGTVPLDDWVTFLDGYRDLIDRDTFLYRLPLVPEIQVWFDSDERATALTQQRLADLLDSPRSVWRTATPALVRIEIESDQLRWTWVSWRQWKHDDGTTEERRCLTYGYLSMSGALELQLPHHNRGGMRALLAARDEHVRALTDLLGVAPTLVHLEAAMRALMTDHRMTLSSWRIRPAIGGILSGQKQADLFERVRPGLEKYYALELAGEWTAVEDRTLSIGLDARTDAVTIKEQCARRTTTSLLAALREQAGEATEGAPSRSAAEAQARGLVEKVVTYQRQLGHTDTPLERLASKEATGDLLFTAATLQEALEHVGLGNTDAAFYISCPTTQRPVRYDGRELRFDRLSDIPEEVRCENESDTPRMHPTKGNIRVRIEQPIRPRKHVVLLLHGIRTQGEWQQRVAATLENEPTILVRPTRYEFLDVLRFLLPIPPLHRRPIERITRLVRDELTKKPDRLSIVAHSFGTFIVSKILKNEADIDLHRLLLCGSIIPTSFPWELYRHRFSPDTDWQVVNDCGMSDIWPVLAQSVTWGYGSSGRFGFGHGRVKDRFHTVGHSGFFSEEFVRAYWLPYLTEGRIAAGSLDRPTTPWALSLLTVLKLRYLIIAALAVGAVVALLLRAF